MIVTCRHTEDSHVKTNTVHTLFRVQKYGLMPLEQFQDILTPSDIKRCKKSQTFKEDVVFIKSTCIHELHLPGMM